MLLEDSEGIVADLDAGIQRSIDAYTDPWGQDAKQPATPGPVPPVPAPDRSAEGARPMSLTDLTTAAPVDRRRARRRTPSAWWTTSRWGRAGPSSSPATQVAVFRLRDGSLHATQAACPHAGGPLADGQTDVNVLVCPLHQYAYRWSDGASTSGGSPIRTYPVRERDGYLVVEV